MKPEFEYAILGGGAAGLSLALRLVDSPLGDRPILLVEKSAKQSNDRTWCFWGEQPLPFEQIRRAVWDELVLRSPEGDARLKLDPYRYQMLRGIDFYTHAYAILEKCPTVTVVRGAVEDVTEGDQYVSVRVGETVHTAAWAFDSRILPGKAADSPGSFNLIQHFRGWEVETSQPIFDPSAATLFDLNAPQPEGLAFFYVLPFSEHKALVEYTLFSCNVLPPEQYDQNLRMYLERLGAGDYRVIEEEAGVIPMTDRPLKRRQGRRILAIGTRGGQVKPSTGYAFVRIQRDTNAIVRSLEKHGHPFDLPRSPARYRFYDSLLLDLLDRSDPRLVSIFTALFERNPAGRVFRFLDESASFFEDLQVLASLPAGPFLAALIRKMKRVFYAKS